MAGWLREMQEDTSNKTNTRPATLEGCWELISNLTNVIATLTDEISKLKEQLNLNSNNSSIPPSKDFKRKKAKTQKAPSGKKRGGQAGQ